MTGTRPTWWYRVSIVMGVVPIVVAALRDGFRGWVPTHDAASVALRSYQVLGSHPPLIGMWSEASGWAGLQIHMVGPMELYLLAVPVRLLGPSWGLLLGMATINSVCVCGVAWLVRRRLGPWGAVLAMAFLVSLMWSMGSEVLIDSIPMNLGPIPFALLLVAAWSVADADLVALPVLAVVATYLFQTHLGFVLLVPVLSAWAVGSGTWRVVRARRADGEMPPGVGSAGRLVRWTGATAVVMVACWFAPVWEEFNRDPGNLSALAHSVTHGSPRAPALHTVFESLTNTVALPPAWLPPSFAHPNWGLYHPHKLWASIVWFVVLVGLLVTAVVSAWRRGDHTLRAGLGVAVVGLAVAAMTIKHSTSEFGVIAGYVRWLWSLAMFTWFCLVVAFARAVRHRRGVPSVLQEPRIAPLAGLAVVAVLAAAALPTADHGASTASWTIAPTKQLSRQVFAHLPMTSDVYLVQRIWSPFALSCDASLALALERRGIPFVVDENRREQQYGTQHAFTGHNATGLILLSPNPSLPAPYVRLGFATAASPAEARELTALDAQVTAWVAAQPLRPSPLIVANKVPAVFQSIVQKTIDNLNAERDRPSYVVTSGDLVELAHLDFPDARGRPHPFIDTTGIGEATFMRWAALQQRLRQRQLAVYRAPLGAKLPPDVMATLSTVTSAAAPTSGTPRS